MSAGFVKFENSQGLICLHQPSPQAFSARSVLDSSVSCDVNEGYWPTLSQNGLHIYTPPPPPAN